jgi:hypothetical protein
MTEQTDAAEVAELADGFLASRLSWGTHADRWNDADWQRRFWTEVAQTLLASGWYADTLAAREAAARAEALRGILFRVETACDGYSHLMDEDVPGGVTDLAAYEQGAHDAAEAIRTTARTDGAGS